MNILFSVIQYEDINFNIIPMLIIDNIRNNLCNSELNNIHLQVELFEISEKYFNFNKKIELQFWDNLSKLKKKYFEKDSKIYDIIQFNEYFWDKSIESVWYSIKRHFNRIKILKKGFDDAHFQNFFKKVSFINNDWNNEIDNIHDIMVKKVINDSRD